MGIVLGWCVGNGDSFCYGCVVFVFWWRECCWFSVGICILLVDWIMLVIIVVSVWLVVCRWISVVIWRNSWDVVSSVIDFGGRLFFCWLDWCGSVLVGDWWVFCCLCLVVILWLLWLVSWCVWLGWLILLWRVVWIVWLVVFGIGRSWRFCFDGCFNIVVDVGSGCFWVCCGCGVIGVVLVVFFIGC